MKTLLLSILICLGTIGILRADPVIGFDDLPSDQLPVPAGYHLLTWSNIYYVNGVTYSLNPSGYQAGVVSPSDVVYNGDGDPAAISAGMFDFLSAYVTAAWNDNLQFEAKGYIQGTLVYDQTNTLSATAPTLISFNYYGVDTVVLQSSGGTPHAGYSGGGTQFAMDNVSVQTYLPFLAPLITNGGFETGTLSSWGNFGNTNNTFVTTNSEFVHSGNYGLEIGPDPTPGYLIQGIDPTQIGQWYTVSFWLENEGSGANYFTVYWGGVPVFGLTNSPAFGWTNYQLNLQATLPNEDLEFQFENTPSFFGFDDVSVTPTLLVSNGGFETGDFSGWFQSGATGENFVNNILVRSGSYGAQMGGEGALGFISQPITTQPGQPYLLSLWLDSPDGQTPNEYQSSWAGQILDDESDLGAFGWTNLHYTALSADTQSTLQLGFRDDPEFLGVDDVSVYPVPILQNGGFELGDLTGWPLTGNTLNSSVTTDTNYVDSGFYGGKFGAVGSLAYITQTFPTIPGQAYVINLSLFNPTNMVDAPVTEFQVSWNGAVLVDTTNLGYIGWFPFQFMVTASETNSTLQLGLRDDPLYLGLDNVSVSPVSAPVIQSISKNNNLVNMTWTAWPGYAYVPQYTTNLSQPNWQQLENLFYFDVTPPMQTTDTNPPDAQRFYRIQMLPPPLS